MVRALDGTALVGPEHRGAGPSVDGLTPRWRSHPWVRAELPRRSVRRAWSADDACALLASSIPAPAHVAEPERAPLDGRDRLALWVLGEPGAAADLLLDVASAGGLPSPQDRDEVVVGGCVPRGMPSPVGRGTSALDARLPEILHRPPTSSWDWFWFSAHPDALARPGPAVTEVPPGGARDAVVDCLRVANPGAELDPRDPSTRWWGARSDDGPAGVLSAVAGAHPAVTGWEIGGIATLPDARGRGLAGAVLRAATRAALADAGLATLGMYADNASGRRLYESAGYVVGQRFSGWRVLRASQDG
ncbi:hypothetical protein GCM10025865_27970 [Paraoerskovia sediminicola]|uniref:N-acetyltransferase domain-containing protein n=1 Tax=Paraoerskovia sediminicola TaxID=1138587 RepID=A0ABN6XF07_9CELL|nr:GNAT family N-acetyltransferase [Paraoerskovia sediminicola]BDZ43498.1 hypothetical protein GCM10025865_27970 [Paraoerskovia sediminicola]